MNPDQSHAPSSTVLKEPIQRDRLIQLLNDALDQLYPRESRKQSPGDRGKNNPRTRSLRKAQVRYNAFRATIGKFGQFLSDSNLAEVAVDERLIQDFDRHLSGKGNPASYLLNHRKQIRKLINAIPADLRQRELATMVAFTQAHRWDGYSKETPEILAEFVRHGRKLSSKSSRQSPELSSVPLSETYREQIVRTTMTFLRAIEATDILTVTSDDVEEFLIDYEDSGKRKAALSMLNYIRPLFTNLLAKGKIASDPLADLPRREHYENLDYVPQEGMDKLADLSTVDMNDFKDVRDRLICFSLYYDFALRNREGSLLKVADLNLNGHTSLILPKEIQKIQREDSLLFSYFPETTRPLIDRYLELRARLCPATDILLISGGGVPLLADGCRIAVRAHCDRLGIKTFGGQTPTPHRLRHSFGSLNINPLGRCLDIIEVKEQYRHSSIETTYKLYVAKNTILKTRRYEARMQANRNGNGNGGGHPIVNGYGLAPAVVPAFPQASRPPVDVLPPDGFIPEDEAIRRVRGLGLDYRTLRAYGIKAGKVQPNGRGFDYSVRFIADLAGNYLTSQEAMDFLHMPKSSFFAWRNSHGVEFVQIGQVGLYRRDEILLKKRSG